MLSSTCTDHIQTLIDVKGSDIVIVGLYGIVADLEFFSCSFPLRYVALFTGLLVRKIK